MREQVDRDMPCLPMLSLSYLVWSVLLLLSLHSSSPADLHGGCKSGGIALGISSRDVVSMLYSENEKHAVPQSRESMGLEIELRKKLSILVMTLFGIHGLQLIWWERSIIGRSRYIRTTSSKEVGV